MVPILTLPTELLQAILSLTDTQTYISSRLVCRRWHHASATPFLLRDALAKIPPSVIAPSLPSLDALRDDAWNGLFEEVCRRNLVRCWRRTQKTTRRSSKRGTNSIPVTATSSDGGKTVVLQGAQVTVHEHGAGNSFVFTLAPSLYPLWTSICRALLRSSAGLGGNQGYAKHRLAISSHARLVAVALGKTIQIYEYGHVEEGHSHRRGPAEYILGQTESAFVSSVCPPPGANYRETDGVVEKVEFVEKGALLRVAVGKESNPNRSSRVRYLGDPSLCLQPQQVSLGYWKQALNRVYLDSVALATNLPNNDYKTAFKGLCLLPSSFPGSSSSPFSRCCIAALQTQDTQEYCIANMSPSQIKIAHHFPSKTSTLNSPTPESTHLFLEKYTQTDKATTTQNLHRASLSRWDPVHLPAASTQNPVIHVSDDNRVLVVYEPGAGHSFGYLGGGAVYVYSMHPASGSELDGDGGVRVRPWSFLLDIVDVDVETLSVVRREEGTYRVTGTAMGGQEVTEWCLG